MFVRTRDGPVVNWFRSPKNKAEKKGAANNANTTTAFCGVCDINTNT